MGKRSRKVRRRQAAVRQQKRRALMRIADGKGGHWNITEGPQEVAMHPAGASVTVRAPSHAVGGGEHERDPLVTHLDSVEVESCQMGKHRG